MTHDPISILESDVSEPIEDVIAKAERQAAQASQHLEFIVTLHGAAGAEFHRQPVRFVRIGTRFVSAEEVAAVAPVDIAREQLRMYLRDALSDVPLVWLRPRLPPMLAGDSVTFDAGVISAGFVAEDTE